MHSLFLSSWLQRRGIHYAWMIALLTFLTMLVTSAALGLPGALLLPIAREFGSNADSISSSLALRFVLFGLLGPFAAVLIDRHGIRAVTCAALILVGFGTGAAALATQVWNLTVLWGLMLGVGTGLTALVLAATVTNRWFDKRRGLVIGMLTASSATGQLVFLPFAAWLIEHHGWRSAVIPVAILCAIVAVLAYCFMAERPEKLGLRPYGAEEGAAAPAARPAARPTFATSLSVLGSAVRVPAFWVLSGTFFICGLSTNGLIQTHFISLCGDFGLAPVPAASVLAMMGVFDLVGTVSSGWLSDRYDSRKLLFWYYGLRGLSLFWLPHSTFTFYGLSLFAVFYGLDWIATVPPTVKLTSSTFGKERTAMVFGWIFASHQLGAAVAAYGAGLVRAITFSYTPSLYVAGAACVLAALSIFVSVNRAQATSY
jgi:MFS family permease